MLASTDPTFPMDLWDLLLEQAELTMNLMRSSSINSKVSAWAYVHGGPYRFSETPIAPAGTAVLVYESPAVRGSWAVHGKAGFYIGPAMKHYRCFKVYVTETSRERVTDTLSWHPVAYKLPGSSPLEELNTAVKELFQVCKKMVGTHQGTHGQKDPRHVAEATLNQSFRMLSELFGNNRGGMDDGVAGRPQCAHLDTSGAQGDLQADANDSDSAAATERAQHQRVQGGGEVRVVSEQQESAQHQRVQGGVEMRITSEQQEPVQLQRVQGGDTHAPQATPDVVPEPPKSQIAVHPVSGPPPTAVAGKVKQQSSRRVPWRGRASKRSSGPTAEDTSRDPYVRVYKQRQARVERFATAAVRDVASGWAFTSVDLDSDDHPLKWTGPSKG